MNNVHLTLWVTSVCNLICPYCSHKNARNKEPNYNMSFSELQNFIDSSYDRKIHYAAVELTGGEPTLWPHFNEALRLLHSSKITDWVTFVTNGNNATEVSKVASLYAPSYIVSSSQATSEQLQIHKDTNPHVQINNHQHKPIPEDAVFNSRPAKCCIEINRHGIKTLPLAYYQNRIYHCCNSLSLGGEHLSVPFESDFVKHFASEPRDQEICSRCLCNALVWERI